MSVYLPKDKNGNPRTKYYQYDFQVRPKGAKKSQRFYGATTKAAAKRIEAEYRELAKLGKLNHAMTVNQAAWQYWEEHASRKRSADDLSDNIENLTRCLGPETKLVDITPGSIADAMLQRSQHRTVRKKVTQGHLPKGSTVNRQILEPARMVLKYAKRFGASRLTLARLIGGHWPMKNQKAGTGNCCRKKKSGFSWRSDPTMIQSSNCSLFLDGASQIGSSSKNQRSI